jgi:hypothetical protein
MTGRAIRELQLSLAGAQDAKLREIVALVDSLPRRGLADNVIAPLRERLRRLRPARRMNARRLIFLPADRAIVPAAQWKRGMLAIPRHVLACLTDLVCAELGDSFAAFARAFDGTASDDIDIVLHHGRWLWPLAGAILARAVMPPEWAAATGLGLTDYNLIARPLAILLGAAGRVEELAQLGIDSERAQTAIRTLLAQAQTGISALPESNDEAVAQACLGLLIEVCLQRLPDARDTLTAAADLASRGENRHARPAADAALDCALSRAEAGLAASDPPMPLGELLQLAELLDVLDQPGPAGRPAGKARTAALRRNLDAHCRQRFQSELTGKLLPMAAMLSATMPDDALLSIEETARDLRRLEAIGRMAGGSAHYERALADSAAALPALAAGARAVDLARLIEILQGPEAALAFLDAAAAVR